MSDAQRAAAGLPWLLRFRALAVFGQLGVLMFMQKAQGVAVNWLLASVLLLVQFGSNLALGYLARSERIQRHLAALPLMGFAMVLDTLLLTGVLALSGGAANPFSILYIAQIVLSALLLNATWTGWTTAAGAAGFAALFLAGSRSHHPGPAMEMGGAHHDFDQHLVGMWVAFACAATMVAYFVRQISKQQERQQQQIELLRQRALKAAHFASLTTLAAGAAHELRTPLSTMSVAAGELEQELEALEQGGSLSDVRLIQEEIDRCQSILSKMGPRFSDARQDAGWHAVPELLKEAAGALRLGPVSLHLGPPSRCRIHCARREVTEAVHRLLENALLAVQPQAEAGEIWLDAQEVGGQVRICVKDNGPGMTEATIAQAPDPFFTTRQPGEGMGLGLFLVNALAFSLGGRLMLESAPGTGTIATLALPIQHSGPGERA